MARPKRESAPAEAHNEDTEEVRQSAREASGNVVDFVTETEQAKRRIEVIRRLADELDVIAERDAEVKDDKRRVRLDAESYGIDWKALSQMVTQRRQKAAKREAWERSRRDIARAFGWDDGAQQEMFREESLPGLDRPFLGDEEPGVDAAIAAAIEQGWLSEEEIAANRALDGDGYEVEEADESGDLDEELLARAGVPVVSEDDA